MAEYIERETLVERLTRNLNACNPGTFSEMCYQDAINTVTAFPAADVAPVRHGRWIYKHRHRGGFRIHEGFDEFGEMHRITVDERIELDEPYCSECGKWNESIYLDYCPNCGAKMDLEG